MKDTKNVIIDVVSSGISMAAVRTVFAPLDRIKLILQTQDANVHVRNGEVERYDGIIDSFTRIPQEQGYLSFWRGNLIAILRFYPTLIVNFILKDSIKNMMPRYNPRTDFGKFFAVQLTSGMLAAGASMAVVYPLNFVRNRLATDVGTKRDFDGVKDCITKTVTGPNGFFSMYTGYLSSVFSVIPYRVIYFGLHYALSDNNPYHKEKSTRGIVSRFTVAQVTATTADLLIYPLSTVIYRLQLQAEKPQEEWVYYGYYDCFRKIVKEEGVVGLYKGYSVTIIQSVSRAAFDYAVSYLVR
jgi:solute carrier family 25 (adenine nucleotide translocator) protein 4/5/6/31